MNFVFYEIGSDQEFANRDNRKHRKQLVPNTIISICDSFGYLFQYHKILSTSSTRNDSQEYPSPCYCTKIQQLCMIGTLHDKLEPTQPKSLSLSRGLALRDSFAGFYGTMQFFIIHLTRQYEKYKSQFNNTKCAIKIQS